MAERMTSIRVRGANGFSCYGRRSPGEMIKEYRDFAALQMAEAKAVLDAKDEDFRIETHTSPYH